MYGNMVLQWGLVSITICHLHKKSTCIMSLDISVDLKTYLTSVQICRVRIYLFIFLK